MLAEYGLRGASGVVSVNAPGRAEAAVDLVGRDLDEAFDAGRAGGVEQDLRADHVGATNGSAVMMLRSTWLSAAKLTTASIACARMTLQHRRAVADVAAHEDVPGVALQVAQVLEVAGVGQGVEVDDQIVRPRAPDQMDVG